MSQNEFTVVVIGGGGVGKTVKELNEY